MLAIGNEELGADIGAYAKCPNCKKKHLVRYGERILADGSKVPSKILAYVKCGKKLFLVGINGKEIK